MVVQYEEMMWDDDMSGKYEEMDVENIRSIVVKENNIKKSEETILSCLISYKTFLTSV